MIFNGYEVCLIKHSENYIDKNAIKSGLKLTNIYYREDKSEYKIETIYALGIIYDYGWTNVSERNNFRIMQTFSEKKQVVKMMYKNNKGIYIKLNGKRKYIDINIEDVFEYIGCIEEKEVVEDNDNA